MSGDQDPGIEHVFKQPNGKYLVIRDIPAPEGQREFQVLQGSDLKKLEPFPVVDGGMFTEELAGGGHRVSALIETAAGQKITIENIRSVDATLVAKGSDGKEMPYSKISSTTVPSSVPAPEKPMTLAEFTSHVEKYEARGWQSETQGPYAKTTDYTFAQTPEEKLKIFQHHNGIENESPADALKPNSKTMAKFNEIVAHPERANKFRDQEEHGTGLIDPPAKPISIKDNNNALVQMEMIKFEDALSSVNGKPTGIKAEADVERVILSASRISGVSADYPKEVATRPSATEPGIMYMSMKGISEADANKLVNDLNAKYRVGATDTGQHSVGGKLYDHVVRLPMPMPEQFYKDMHTQLNVLAIGDPNLIGKLQEQSAVPVTFHDAYVHKPEVTPPLTKEQREGQAAEASYVFPSAEQIEGRKAEASYKHPVPEAPLPPTPTVAPMPHVEVHVEPATKIAELPTSPARATEGVSSEHPAFDKATTTMLQTAMAKLGMDLGHTGAHKNGVDGGWGGKTEAAFAKLCADAKITSPDQIDFSTAPNAETQKLLDHIKTRIEATKILQKGLEAIGEDVGKIDGAFGPKTKKALEHVCKRAGVDINNVDLFSSVQTEDTKKLVAQMLKESGKKDVDIGVTLEPAVTQAVARTQYPELKPMEHKGTTETKTALASHHEYDLGNLTPTFAGGANKPQSRSSSR